MSPFVLVGTHSSGRVSSLMFPISPPVIRSSHRGSARGAHVSSAGAAPGPPPLPPRLLGVNLGECSPPNTSSSQSSISGAHPVSFTSSTSAFFASSVTSSPTGAGWNAVTENGALVSVRMAPDEPHLLISPCWIQSQTERSGRGRGRGDVRPEGLQSHVASPYNNNNNNRLDVLCV